MSSSPEFTPLQIGAPTEPAPEPVLRGGVTATLPEPPELRTGVWTRLGDDRVLGDAVTEQGLAILAERTREAARSQGYAVGWAQGRRAAEQAARTEAAEAAERRTAIEERQEAEHRAAVAALELAAARLHASLEAVCGRVEDSATEIAFELTRTLLDRETAADPGADAVARALALLPPAPAVRVMLHPADLATTAVGELTERGVTLVADPSLERGDALVEADDHVLDLRLSTALARVREVLG